jgi:hypothetical protein
MKYILFIGLALSLSISAQAQTSTLSVELDGIQGALDARDGFVQALQNKDYTGITHQAFDAAIQELAQSLRDQNDNAMADELLAKWQQSSFEGALSFAMSNKDLGDHAPLFPWLEAFFTKMSNKYGTIILSLPIVQNIRTLNFAIPVVFSPRSSSWQSAGVDPRIEYRKHFIPFANLVTYYASLVGCDLIVKKEGMGQLKQLCGKVATKLEFVMGRYIAPQISDWIFKEANSSTEITNKQLVYTNAEQLREAIEKN